MKDELFRSQESPSLCSLLWATYFLRWLIADAVWLCSSSLRILQTLSGQLVPSAHTEPAEHLPGLDPQDVWWVRASLLLSLGPMCLIYHSQHVTHWICAAAPWCFSLIGTLLEPRGEKGYFGNFVFNEDCFMGVYDQMCCKAWTQPLTLCTLKKRSAVYISMFSYCKVITWSVLKSSKSVQTELNGFVSHGTKLICKSRTINTKTQCSKRFLNVVK